MGLFGTFSGVPISCCVSKFAHEVEIPRSSKIASVDVQFAVLVLCQMEQHDLDLQRENTQRKERSCRKAMM